MPGPILYTIASRLLGGGIGNTAYHEAAGLYRAGLLGEMVCMGADAKAAPFGKTTGVRFLPRRVLSPLSDQRYYQLRNMWFDRVATRRVEHSDRLHAWTGQCPNAIEKAKKLGRMVVLHRASSHILTQRDLLAAEFERLGLPPVLPLASVVKACLEEYDLADRIVVPAEHVRQSFLDHGVSSEKLFVNPFGVNTERFQPSGSKPESSLRILFAGEVGVRKGALRLLEMFTKLQHPDAVLDVAGSVKPAVEGLVARYRNNQNIVFHGYVSDVRELFARAHIFFFPTVEEGSALVTYEAMASGLPVVTTTRSGAVCEHGKSGFMFDADDEDGMLEALRTLLADRELRNYMGHEARNRAVQFTWEAFGDRAAEFHKELR